jgi:SAM-dependent methyltransferase
MRVRTSKVLHIPEPRPGPPQSVVPIPRRSPGTAVPGSRGAAAPEHVRVAQETAHGADHDYILGSPHLQHARLNAWMRDTLNRVVAELADAHGRAPCVLEVGAGHGPFTETLVAAGADVVVTEMSAASAALLEHRFRANPRVTVNHDPHGHLAGHLDVDLVVYMSVLHHIPDYLASLAEAAEVVRPGGAIVSFQDPMWYPRRSRASLVTDRAARLAWRVFQGEIRRGVATQFRRARGIYDETNPSDMSEYHCVRDGVDERAIVELLDQQFADVALLPYWSTPSAWGQGIGARWAGPNTFGIVATAKR